jgi:hypothetical protein
LEELTPSHDNRNLAFVAPNGDILGFAKPSMDGQGIEAMGAYGSNNYNDFWTHRMVYLEENEEN